jgi:N-methylhydantoinase A
MIPLYPGYFSAWGMLATEPRRDFVQTALTRADAMTAARVRELFAGLGSEAEKYFGGQDGVAAAELVFEFAVDLRYFGQEHWVTVAAALEDLSVDGILHDFHIAHERAYTFRLDDTPVEFVNFRLTATARVPRPTVKPLNGAGRSEAAATKGTRSVHFGEDGRHEARIFERDLLPPGFAAAGPLIVEEPSANTIVHPGQGLRVDELGFLHISAE